VKTLKTHDASQVGDALHDPITAVGGFAHTGQKSPVSQSFRWIVFAGRKIIKNSQTQATQQNEGDV
jgi:hypothetical protein